MHVLIVAEFDLTWTIVVLLAPPPRMSMKSLHLPHAWSTLNTSISFYMEPRTTRQTLP